MSIRGQVHTRFIEYMLYGEVLNADAKIAVYRRDIGTGKYVKHKELDTLCLFASESGGFKVECTASDTSNDVYTADAFAIVRSWFVVDNVASQIVMIHYTTVSKTRDQRLDVELIAEITV